MIISTHSACISQKQPPVLNIPILWYIPAEIVQYTHNTHNTHYSHYKSPDITYNIHVHTLTKNLPHSLLNAERGKHVEEGGGKKKQQQQLTDELNFTKIEMR